MVSVALALPGVAASFSRIGLLMEKIPVFAMSLVSSQINVLSIELSVVHTGSVSSITNGKSPCSKLRKYVASTGTDVGATVVGTSRPTPVGLFEEREGAELTPTDVGGSVPKTNEDGIVEGTSEAPMAAGGSVEGKRVAGAMVPPIVLGAEVLGLSVLPAGVVGAAEMGGDVPGIGGRVLGLGVTPEGAVGVAEMGANVPVLGGDVTGGDVPVVGGNDPVKGGNVDGTTVVGAAGTNVVGGNVTGVGAGTTVPGTGLKDVGDGDPKPGPGDVGGTVTAIGLEVAGACVTPAIGLEDIGLKEVGGTVPKTGVGVGADVLVPPAAVGLAVVGGSTATGLLEGGDVPATGLAVVISLLVGAKVSSGSGPGAGAGVCGVK